MIREELKALSTDRRDLRKFGLTVGGVFLALGGWCFFRHRSLGPWLLAGGGTLFLFGSIAPRALRPVYLAWMAVALTLSLVVSTILLTLFFFLVITPIAIFARLIGKDFLSLRLDPHSKSYWLTRAPTSGKPPDSHEQQF